MDREEFLAKVNKAIDSASTQSKTIKRDVLVDELLKEFGLSDVLSYKGWTIYRVLGSELKNCPRGGKKSYGYRCVKEGRDEQQYTPASNGQDMPFSIVKVYLDSYDDLIAKYEKQGMEPKI